ncbi:class I adenylate-forming enzyme family protein [Pseudomonas asplenii]|uniref:class I adenylate-forming enzyme family protein n=1 Tax=Pseudomonas asplenii TaxID=53407 RepID=UPI0003803253|nr:AMP-binding protein [Pseudomonas fuscovaginae]
MFLQQFLKVAARHSSLPAVIDSHGKVTRYGELREDIDHLRARLHAAGLREGDVVVTQLANSTGYVALLFALASLGLVHCPVNVASSTEHRAMRLAQVGAKVLVTESGNLPAGLDVPGFALYTPERISLELPADPERAGLMRMQETSGSTGTPKLSLWRQDRLFREILHWVECAGLDANARYLNIHTLDGGHAVDLHVFPALLTGATLYLGEAALVDATLRTLDEQRISVMSALPSQYLELAQAAQLSGVRLPALTLPFCGGAYLDDQVVREAERCLGIHIKRIYGSTEFGMILANFAPDLQTGCGMHPVGDVEVTLAVLDPEQPEVGEVIARSSHRGSGYFPLADHTQEDEAYATGDIARRLADGSLMLLGRANDALLTATGTQFAPALEGHLAQALKVERVVVLVDQRDNRRAHVVVQANTTPSPEWQPKLVAMLDSLDIAAGIAVLERIPLTPTGKPDRARLRRQLGASHTGKETIIHLKDLT